MKSRYSVLPVRLFCIMQVLGQNSNGAHDRLANIKVVHSLNDAVDDYVDFPAEHLVQRLVLAWLGNTVPRQDQLSVGTLKHWGEQAQREFTPAPSSHTHTSWALHTKTAVTLKLVWWNSSCSLFLSKLLISKLSTNVHERIFYRTEGLVGWDRSVLTMFY